MLLTDHSPTYVIVDALDECPNTPGIPSAREQVLQLLKDLVDLHLPNLHVCVTSSPEIDIRTALDSLGCHALSLHDQRGKKQDIVKYVRSVVYSDPMMKRWREEDKNLVTETLAEKADGMFRWVFCQLEILRHCLPPSLRRTLDELPESLDKTYERILEGIKKPNQVHAHRLLQCLTVAIRPLSVEELGEVLAVDFVEVEGISKLNTDWRWEDQEQALLAACSSLITIANFRGARVVQFSHFSVKEYLTSTRLAGSGGETSRYHIPLERAHATLAQASLSVLFALDEHVDGLSIDRFPLAEYSAQYWINHAQFKNVSTRIQHGMEYIFDPERRHFRVWVRVHDPDKDYWPMPSWAPPPLLEAPAAALYYAALCGFRDIVDRLLTRYPQYLHAMGDVHGTALHAASRGNHCGAAQAMINFSGDVNVRCLSGRTPLHVASSAGHLDAAQWLLHHGAEVNAQDNEGHNPLHLLVREARLQADDETPNGWNRLGSRQCDQSVEVARLLLEHGVDVDAKDRSGQTVYGIASTRGYRDVMKLLPAPEYHLRVAGRTTELHSRYMPAGSLSVE
ncbi:ankyrin repeat-containing domain protein [Russula brevipes]|nr:ankyrin repeat-containing domain protein [Russula brevipes]